MEFDLAIVMVKMMDLSKVLSLECEMEMSSVLLWACSMVVLLEKVLETY